VPTLRDLMTPEVHTLDPDMTLREAVERFAVEGFGGAPVVAGGRLVGVISSKDILEFESTNPGDASFPGEGWESGEWEPLPPWDEEVVDPPSAYFRDMWADSGAELVERIAVPDSPEWDFLAGHVVGEVMTRKVLSLGPDTHVAEAARVMVRSGIHRLLVVENGSLLGIVTTMDLVRAIAEEKLTAR